MVKAFDTIMTDGNYYNIYEYLDGYKDFDKFQQEKYPYLLAKPIFFQLCRGIRFISNLGIMHRDIKPQNIMINPTTYHIKIIDLGK